LGIVTLEVKWPELDVNHSHLVPRLKKSGVTPPLPVFIHTGTIAFD
jgi:hypothetical protein